MVKEEYDPGNKDRALFIGAISVTEGGIPVRLIMSILKTKQNNKQYKVHRNITVLENILPLIELFYVVVTRKLQLKMLRLTFHFQ